MVERNAGVRPTSASNFAIGIHLGDVVEESDGDLMGDGVNIAARLEGIAKPGAICLSEDAYRQVKGRLDLAVTDLGPTQLKNIAEPIRVYSLRSRRAGAGEARDAGDAAQRSRSRRRSASALAPLAAGIAALAHSDRGGAWYFLGANRPATVASNAAAPRPRVFPSSCCPSPISPAIRRRTTSPTR